MNGEKEIERGREVEFHPPFPFGVRRNGGENNSLLGRSC